MYSATKGDMNIGLQNLRKERVSANPLTRYIMHSSLLLAAPFERAGLPYLYQW
jgi:hypothetical protein